MEGQRCKWESTLVAVYKCDEPALPDGYCILHSRDENKNIQEFTKKVDERMGRGTLTSKGWEIDRIDLAGCYFPRSFDGKYFKGRHFNRPVDFHGAAFHEAISYAVTPGVLLSGLSFDNVVFSEGVNFVGTIFPGYTYFFSTQFKGSADFSFVEFRYLVHFDKARFFDSAFFVGTKWGNAHFLRTVGVKWGSAHFSRTEFKGETLFIGVEDEGENEAKEIIAKMAFYHTRFLGEVRFQDFDFSSSFFLNSNLDKVDFRNCKFAGEKGLLFRIISYRRENILADELLAEAEINEEAKKNPIIEKLKKEKYEPVQRLYLDLKRNFEDKKDWNTAGDFHYGEMECRRKGRLGGWLDFLLVTTYYGASGYGERPLRALLWWFFSTLLFFPLLYRLSEHDPLSACVWDSVRVATFMKIGIPIEPESWGRIVLTLQYFICPTLLALFALALRRKVKR